MAPEPTFGIHEAKTKFSKLIQRVRKGHRIIITDRGVPVATLNAYVDQDNAANRKAALNNIRQFRARQKPVDVKIMRGILKADQK